jgi:hypothetical protein
MSRKSNNPSKQRPSAPPPWSEEKDWIVLVEFLPRHNAEDRVLVTEAIGHMLAYAQMTDTRMVALLGDPEADAYELLFSFNSPKNKAEFLHLLRTSEVTSTEDELILIPDQDEINAAQPIASVLPEEVFREVILIATMLTSGQAGSVQ